MAASGLTCFPVVARHHPDTSLGLVSLCDLLKARAALLDAEYQRERVLTLPFVSAGPSSSADPADPPEGTPYRVQ
jgi:hypothetical protein